MAGLGERGSAYRALVEKLEGISSGMPGLTVRIV
jgi:hypothetical protein